MNSFPDYLHTATRLVAAYMHRNQVDFQEMTTLVEKTYTFLERLGQKKIALSGPDNPVVPIDESIQHEFLVCLEDGRKLKMLKRHLKKTYNLTPDEYRAKWGLPQTYPMVAPAYAKRRSTLAKTFGLGVRAKETHQAA